MPFATRHLAPAALFFAFALPVAPGHAAYVNFESQHVHPIALTPDGTKLLAVNTPDGKLAVFAVNGGNPSLLFETAVGVEPVSVAAESNTRAWVVNQISDTVSLVDLLSGNVVETLAVGDEPADVVFANGKAFVSVSRQDAVKIYSVANPAAPPVVVPVFGTDPQALARSADGTRVYVALFESGNQTTIASGPDVVSHGGLPAPNPSGRPNVGLILKYTGGHWVDELNRSFDNTHPYTLPDHDIAILDATAAVPVPQYVDGLGTLLFNLAVHPVTGKLYVTNTDALNQLRFEPTLRGQFLRTRVSIVDPNAPAVRSIVDLNPHINYGVTPGPLSETTQSLSQPGGIVFQAAGGVGYITALGSAKVAVLDDAGNVTARIGVGQGPSGLALDETNHRLYVLNRFDETISIVDTNTRSVDHTLSAGYDPSPPAIKTGRRLLYDAQLASGHGDLACSSCHAGGNFDAIAWDLGDPNGTFQPAPPNQVDPLLQGFHPMKGPMTTQSLRGLSGTQPFHWRGDRADFENFNGAFVSLMGRATPFSGADMQAFKDFVFTIKYAPNPNQNLDRTFPNPASGPSPERGRLAFLNNQLDGPFRCVQCHALPAGTSGQLTDRLALQAPQDMKIPQLRNLYEKTGLTLTPGDKKRGFGFTHDGSEPTLVDFLRLPVFTFPSDAMRQDIEAFLLAFDTGTAPAVGAQRTVYASNKNDPATVQWIETLLAQDQAGNCDLIVKGRLNGQVRGFVYDGAGLFRSDRASEALIAKDALRALAGPGSELTYTGVPPGAGYRSGIDRDEDGYYDRTEIDAGSDPADPASTPTTVAVGPSGSGGRDATLFASYPNPARDTAFLSFELAARANVHLRIYAADGRLVRALLDGAAGPGLVRLQWDGTNDSGNRAASGRYFYRLDTPTHSLSRPLLLVR
jgi:YVTN family beta-propeller protein